MIAYDTVIIYVDGTRTVYEKNFVTSNPKNFRNIMKDLIERTWQGKSVADVVLVKS